MRLPRMQVTVMGLLAAVALMAPPLWAFRMWERANAYLVMAAMHRDEERMNLAAVLDFPGSKREHERQAAYHASLARRYEWAARHPWRDFSPGPPPDPRRHFPRTIFFGHQPDPVPESGSIGVTLRVVPRSDGKSFRDGDNIRCEGTVTWEGVNPPDEVLLLQRPGSLIDLKNFPACSCATCPVNVTSQQGSTRSGRGVWSGEIVASAFPPGVNEFCIQAIPLAKGRLEFHKDGESIMEYQRVRVVK
jgi:hypothetical protein